ncbi:MAG: FtsQ-type POTRA domain-containing protein [Acidimicrobiia bacterium]|nr:FtsQ-type POTRA domain-containing protein [Acidimicrobiia bacterium]
MDSRLTERRAQVAEDRARRNLTRLFVLLVVVGVVVAGFWFARSPFLSIDELQVEGVSNSDTTTILEEQGLVWGRPLVLIRGGRVEEALLRDPWIAEAEVRKAWPSRVEVAVTEKVAVVWAQVNGQWSLLAGDGTILKEAAAPDESMLIASIVGETEMRSPILSEVAAFAVEIPDVFRDGARIEVNGDSAQAVVEGYTIQLGRVVDLGDKGRVVASLIASGVDRGSVLNVSSPLNPAVRPPGGVDGEDGEDGATSTTAPETTTPTETVPITTVVG